MDGSSDLCDMGGLTREYRGDGCSDISFPTSTHERTLYTQTGAAENGYYRRVDVLPDRLMVHKQACLRDNMKFFGGGGGSSWKHADSDSIYFPIRVHLYDDSDNHVGINEYGDIERQIDGSVYSIFPAIDQDSSSVETPTHMCEGILAYTDSANLKYEIHGESNGYGLFALSRGISDGKLITAYYDSLIVTDSFVGYVYSDNNSPDFSIYLDQNSDGVIDDIVRPSSFVGLSCGDVNGSGYLDIDDVVYLVGFIFLGGPAPLSLDLADSDCSGSIDIDDIVYLVNYIFIGGNAPCDVDGDGTSDC